ncbi:MBL fold metallo-hydrolase [Diaphorobacter sp. HDW4B]|uniref:MBL fold metallo-hydrolase n=1 Tax=Diaphorobacter sp. HDW4B TaxID=2714925 RepID=UPI00140E1E3E|nr:MBL fold metallo-hydrolase [Diaphorobacter sp. HDW4B]QIL71516.1 MBL fold metallo-hydrolase [Diaphorobacter sp. HDW4B]
MPRSNQQLHTHREPVKTRPAATVLLLRDAPRDNGDNNGETVLEVLMTRRSPNASFLPGAYVFPGGGIDAQDASSESHAQTDHRATQNAQRVTEAVAGIRETFEELGILLARHADDGRFADATDIAALDRKQPFVAQCAARGLRLVADDMHVLAHWTADRTSPKRFSVPFLVRRMPEGQEPVADESEQFEPVWVRPADALAQHKDGKFFMIFPTIRTLDYLTKYATVQSLMDVISKDEEPLWNCCPRSGLVKGRETRFMDHEPAFGELAMVTPDGQILHPLDWQSERAVPLLKNVQRLTAPNPGVMTGPGTNSYLVGDPSTGYIAIDPGPADAEHLERLWRAAGGDIRQIVCTHSHPDHSPGARPLQDMVAQYGKPKPPVLGLASKPTSRVDSQFTPDRDLADGELLQLRGPSPDGEITHTLQAIHTPGHAANHVCLLLQEDNLLFSGDHVLNGSTTVVSPPDGNMDDYLQSLDKLDAACARFDVQFIAPAHGYVIEKAREAIAKLKAHRLAREAKVLKAMQKLPSGDLDDWVKIAYDDVPERMWPVALRSLQAHVDRIRSMEPGN